MSTKIQYWGILFSLCSLIYYGSSQSLHAKRMGAGGPVMGCGSLAFYDEGMTDSSILRITTSPVALSSSTTMLPSMTSGTSGCEGNQYGYLNENAAYFLARNYTELSEQSAQGQGPHLATLAKLLGCHPQQLPQLQEMMKRQYATLFPGKANTHPRHQLNTLWQLMQQHSSLKQQCFQNSGALLN